MLNFWGVPVVEVVRGLDEEGTYRGEIGDGVEEIGGVDEIDKLEESEIDTGNGTTDIVVSAG